MSSLPSINNSRDTSSSTHRERDKNSNFSGQYDLTQGTLPHLQGGENIQASQNETNQQNGSRKEFQSNKTSIKSDQQHSKQESKQVKESARLREKKSKEGFKESEQQNNKQEIQNSKEGCQSIAQADKQNTAKINQQGDHLINCQEANEKGLLKEKDNSEINNSAQETKQKLLLKKQKMEQKGSQQSQSSLASHIARRVPRTDSGIGEDMEEQQKQIDEGRRQIEQLDKTRDRINEEQSEKKRKKEKIKNFSRSHSQSEGDASAEKIEEAKVKKINEKKRGIRDLTTDEKWGSYRGVGRIFNMDHSTVKLLIHRINNERPGEAMTKELFLTTSLAQPASEHPIVKKLKKEKSDINLLKKKKSKQSFYDNQDESGEERYIQQEDNNILEGQGEEGGDLDNQMNSDGGYQGLDLLSLKNKKSSKQLSKKHKTLLHYVSAENQEEPNLTYMSGFEGNQLGGFSEDNDMQSLLKFNQQQFESYGETQGDQIEDLSKNSKIQIKQEKQEQEDRLNNKKNRANNGAMQFFYEGQIHLGDPDSPQIETPPHQSITYAAVQKKEYDPNHLLENIDLLSYAIQEQQLLYLEGQQITNQSTKDEYDINFDHLEFHHLTNHTSTSTNNNNNNAHEQQQHKQSCNDEIKLDLS